MSNPFEDEDGSFFVVVNTEGQHALWPSFATVPDGWSTVYGDATRAACLEYISANWTDMRPASLAESAAGA